MNLACDPIATHSLSLGLCRLLFILHVLLLLVPFVSLVTQTFIHTHTHARTLVSYIFDMYFNSVFILILVRSLTKWTNLLEIDCPLPSIITFFVFFRHFVCFSIANQFSSLIVFALSVCTFFLSIKIFLPIPFTEQKKNESFTTVTKSLKDYHKWNHSLFFLICFLFFHFHHFILTHFFPRFDCNESG